MISNTCSLPEKLQLIYNLERLCLGSLFEEEINVVVAQMSNSDVSGCDLHTVSLWSYLLRAHRYEVSSDVFAKFKDEEGTFAWRNPQDLLSLYNAAYYRIHGEIILDEAISFSKTCLESIVPYLEQEGTFSREITRAFQIPIPRRVKAYEAKFYISVFENENTVDRMILELGKIELQSRANSASTRAKNYYKVNQLLLLEKLF
ncbi:hypothetical protein PR202_gb08023 [Eleusine coracana subsp. coracana]|uniref:Terpene synthase N-terminal domain-containing protein n=1 Tax=Eleusine coracana subsp. coracana TaxID=191504 RepID=A0AAV5EB47_ELECO|nr:hypothetical protein PR202_gb08023 [Eleusine coracana subsp. coracana]